MNHMIHTVIYTYIYNDNDNYASAVVMIPINKKDLHLSSLMHHPQRKYQQSPCHCVK